MASLLLAVLYLAFIGLGLPDSLLGAAWPTMYEGFGVPLSSAGILSIIVSLCTITSSLLNDRLSFRLGTGRLTALSVGLTMSPLFDWIAENTTLALYPVYLLAVLALMFFLFRSLPKEKA